MLHFTLLRLVPSTQHWIVGTDAEDDKDDEDDESPSTWSKYKLAPSGGIKTDGNPATPHLHVVTMPAPGNLFKRYAILADTKPAIKTNKHGFLSSETYARVSDPTYVLDRTMIMATMLVMEVEKGGVVLDAEEEEEVATIPEPDQMLQEKISKEDSDVAKRRMQGEA